MSYLTANNEEELIDIILSVNDSLLFYNIETVNKMMKSISFMKDENYSTEQFTWIKYKGIIDGQIIKLHITHDPANTSDKAFYLTEKIFYKNFGLCSLQHRDNDLPAHIRYNIENVSEIYQQLSYYVCGEESRSNPKDPTMIYKSKNKTQYFYRVPEELTNNDFYVRKLNIIDKTNKIKDAIIHYGDFKCSMETLTTTLPETINFTIEDFVNLNERLSIEEKQLIQIANI